MQKYFFYNLVQLRKVFARSLETVCSRWGLTQNEAAVVLFLAENPDMDRASDIVLYQGLAKSHVSLSISQLEAGEILRKQPDGEDRRITHLKLTPKGAAIGAELQQEIARLENQLFGGVTPEEMEQFQLFAQKITRNIARLG